MKRPSANPVPIKDIHAAVVVSEGGVQHNYSVAVNPLNYERISFGTVKLEGVSLLQDRDVVNLLLRLYCH